MHSIRALGLGRLIEGDVLSLRMKIHNDMGLLKGYLATIKCHLERESFDPIHTKMLVNDCLDIVWRIDGIERELTDSEEGVKALVVKGLSNMEISNQLGIDEHTVKFHLTNVFKKLNVKNRAQLIVEHYQNELSIAEQDKRNLQEKLHGLSAGSDRGCAELSGAPMPGDLQ